MPAARSGSRVRYTPKALLRRLRCPNLQRSAFGGYPTRTRTCNRQFRRLCSRTVLALGGVRNTISIRRLITIYRRKYLLLISLFRCCRQVPVIASPAMDTSSGMPGRIRPPSTRSVIPGMYAVFSDAGHATALPTSSGGQCGQGGSSGRGDPRNRAPPRGTGRPESNARFSHAQNALNTRCLFVVSVLN